MKEEYLTLKEVNFMKHSLGLKRRNSHSHRNYYCGKSEIGDYLVSKGFAETWVPEAMVYDYYRINEQGIQMLRKYIGNFKILD